MTIRKLTDEQIADLKRYYNWHRCEYDNLGLLLYNLSDNDETGWHAVTDQHLWAWNHNYGSQEAK